MADVAEDLDPTHAASLGRRYLEDTLRSRPLWIRLIIEFLGTFILVTVAAGAGVINHYAGGNPVSRTAPGAITAAACSPPSGCCHTGRCSTPGRSAPRCSCRSCSGM